MVLIIGDEEVSGLRGDDLFEKFPCLRVASEDLVEEGLREVRNKDLLLLLTSHSRGDDRGEVSVREAEGDGGGEAGGRGGGGWQ